MGGGVGVAAGVGGERRGEGGERVTVGGCLRAAIDAGCAGCAGRG